MRNEVVVIVVSIYVFLTVFGIHRAKGEPCTFADPCICSSRGYVVDLLPVMLERQKPFFAHVDQPSTDYYLNPCGKHLKVSACETLGKTVAGCQIQYNKPYGIANTKGYTGAGDPYNGTVHFTYSFKGADEVLRTTILSVKCSTSDEDEFTFLGEHPQNTYHFLLKTRFACQSFSSSNGLSLGSVLLIIFFVVLNIYFIGGCLFQNFVRNAQGLEIIPNYGFWKELPVLIKVNDYFCSLDVTGTLPFNPAPH